MVRNDSSAERAHRIEGAPAKDAVVEEYSRLAAHYDRRWSLYVNATIRETLRRIEAEPEDVVLDVGCGTGALLHAIARTFPGACLTGVDLSTDMLAVARTKVDPKVTLRQGRAENLPFADEAFDVVVSSSVLHYLRAPDAALREMRRVLKPGGRVVICDWCDDYLACRLCDRILRMVNRAHHKTYGRSECISMLQLAGFEEVDLERFKITWLWGHMTASGTKPAGHSDTSNQR